MGLMNKYNKGTIDWGVETEGLDYVKLQDLEKGKSYKIAGIFINSKGNFGAHPVAICDGFLADIPSHQTENVQKMLADEEVIDAIKAGKVGFEVKTYNATNFGNKECFSVTWIDL